MYELIQIAGNSYYIKGPTNLGLVRLNGTEVCLIDSGIDDEVGRKVRQILDANGWNLTAIYNTHSNADHIGGNYYLQSRTGCKIYAPGMECDFTKHNVMGPSFLYGGFPCKEMRHKFLMAQESDAEYLTKETLPEGVEMIPLPGHYFEMVGFRTPDNVVYLADCLSGRDTLDKYGIVFVYDVASYLNTLEMVKFLEADMFVPAHAEIAEDISELAQYNIEKVWEIGDRIVEICREPIRFELILQRLFTEYGMCMNFEKYVLVGSTVRSYLAWLKDSGRLNVRFEDNMLLWERV